MSGNWKFSVMNFKQTSVFQTSDFAFAKQCSFNSDLFVLNQQTGDERFLNGEMVKIEVVIDTGQIQFSMGKEKK